MVKQNWFPIFGSLSSTITPRKGSCPWTLNCNCEPEVRFVYNKTSENYQKKETVIRHKHKSTIIIKANYQKEHALLKAFAR
jgi:hypothetical protein